MKRLLLFSLLLNLSFLAAFALGVRRLGGWHYAWQRLRHSEYGPYANRADLFARLPARPGAIVLLGDSQIAQCEWQELLGDSIPVLNRGIVGDGVDGLFARLDTGVLRQQPARVFLCIGANDLLFKKPAADIAARYRAIVEKIRHGAPQSTLVLIGVLPVNNAVRRTGLENAGIGALNARIRQIAADQSLSYLDLQPVLTDAAGNLDARFTADGLHLNGAGYLVWKKALAPYLK